MQHLWNSSLTSPNKGVMTHRLRTAPVYPPPPLLIPFYCKGRKIQISGWSPCSQSLNPADLASKYQFLLLYFTSIFKIGVLLCWPGWCQTYALKKLILFFYSMLQSRWGYRHLALHMVLLPFSQHLLTSKLCESFRFSVPTSGFSPPNLFCKVLSLNIQ